VAAPVNVVWIVGEDMGPELGCYGDPQAITPNMDRLAREGARFTRCFTHAPVCAPSRHGLITGQYPIKTGAHHMRSTLINPPVTFTKLLRDAGYFVAWPGKTDFNFKQPASFADSTENWWKKDAPLKEPFFAYANFTQSHESQVRNDNNKYPANTKRLTAAQRHDPAKMDLPPFWPDAPEVREEVARYYDLCTSVDYDVGDILAWLDKQGVADHTVVIFFGDHGRGMPRYKRWVYDTGTHVPLLVRWPGQLKPGSVREELVGFVDLPATTLSLAGVKVPENFDGQVFLGPNAAPARKYVYAARDYMDETFDRIRSVRDKRWQYVRNFAAELSHSQIISYMEIGKTMQVWRKWFAEGRLSEAQRQFFAPTKPNEELYDTESDPYELKNVATNPENSARLEELRGALDEWLKKTDDKGAIPVDQLIARRIITERAEKYAERTQRGAEAVKEELKK
jgi:uncharacterized sulfatase